MKYKQMALILGLAVSTAFYSGCSSNSSEAATNEADQTEESQEQESEDIVYGEVSAIDENKVVINVGTQKEMEKPDDASASKESSESQEENKNKGMGETGEFSMLDLTGEKQEISITESTTFESGGMGRMNVPDGEAPSGEMPTDGEAPSGEMPTDGETKADGETDPEDSTANSGETKVTENNASMGQRGGMQAETQEITLEDIQVGDTVAITLADDGSAEKITVITMNRGGGAGDAAMAGEAAGGVESYTAATDYTEDTEVTDESFSSAGTDENAIHVSEGANVTLSNVDITKESSDSTGGDNSSFYGVGAALLDTDGTTYISNSIIDTDSTGGAGIFSYGDGVIYASDTTITTTQGTSGGIHAAGGGTLYAWDLTASTEGTSSAAIRSDRGGGTMVIDGGNYTSNGTDSPAVYSTADIAVNDAVLTSNAAEAVCIEGLNSLHLYDCDLTGTMTEDSRNDCIWNVILYQSMSGDSEVGNSTFEMNGGTLTSKEGGMFYTTNTESTITLSNVDITYPEENDFFLKCTGNQNERGWGTAGANGADCLFTASDQDMEGDVIWDSISNLDFYVTDASTLAGAVIDDESNVQTTGEGYCSLTIDENSTWIVTDDSILTNLSNAGTIEDSEGKTVTVIGNDGTSYVEGDSKYTITVDTYKESADVQEASAVTQWSSYEVEKPAELA
ncbi:MAG: hypothetical protein EOM40_06345 [Clostridia bacterium]|nr:hypothetical protein [Clostridia bacterium]NCC44690.1 hypothetical protein [Clostridia bacterium]